MSVSSMISWMAALTAGVCSVIFSAAAGAPNIYMVITATVSLGFAALAVRENTKLRNEGANRATVAAGSARYMGLVWVWGALVLLVTYLLILENTWREWMHFFAASAAIGVLCLFFAIVLQRDADQGSEDHTMVNLARYLAIGQLVGMGIAVVGLLVDPDKVFLTTAKPDWAANNVFLFGALALAAISAHSLLSDSAVKE